jgi:Lysylphosphatidylglycerol synthase TM region
VAERVDVDDLPVFGQLDRPGDDGYVDGLAGPSAPGGVVRAGETGHARAVGQAGHGQAVGTNNRVTAADKLATQPSKVVQLFGGQVTAQLVVALALGAALHAFGASLSVAALLIAVTTAGVLASASRRGGGLGCAQAGLILALTAGGIAKGDATAAVFVQRLFSAYLPPIAAGSP